MNDDPVMELLDAIRDEIAEAKADARGPRNDAAILKVAQSVADLEAVVRSLVKMARGDEHAAKEIIGG